MSFNLPESYKPKADNTEEIKRDLVIWDSTNPIALVNMVSSEMKATINSLDRKWFALGERELKRFCNPDLRVQRMRYAFWEEYDRAAYAKRRMNTVNIYAGIVAKDWWEIHVIHDQKNVAWLITPFPEHRIVLREMLDTCISKIRDVLEKNIIKSNQKVDYVLLEKMLKLLPILDNRVNGMVPQRLNINQRTLSMNLNGDMASANGQMQALAHNNPEMTLEQLEEKVRLLKSENAQYEVPGDTNRSQSHVTIETKRIDE